MVDGQPLPCEFAMRQLAFGTSGGISGSTGGISGGYNVWVDEWEDYTQTGDGGYFTVDRGQRQCRLQGERGTTFARNVSHFAFIQTGNTRTTVSQLPPKLPNWPNLPVDTAGVGKIIAGWYTGKCAEFIQTILGNVATKKNPLLEGGDLIKLFNALVNDSKNGGIKRGNPPDGGRVAGGTVRGQMGKGATIYLPGLDERGRPTQEQVNQQDAMGVFHELLHLATKKYNLDKPLAEAIKKSDYGVGDFPSGEGDLDYNAYINDALREHCGIPYSQYSGRKGRL